MRNHRLIVTLSILLKCTAALHAGFNIDASSEAGFQTGVPAQDSGSITENHSYISLDATPAFGNEDNKKFNLEVECPLSYTQYSGGLYDLSVEPEFSIRKNTTNGMSRLSLKTAYYYEPTSLDPTLPGQYLEYGLRYEKRHGSSLSVGGRYGFTTLQEIGSGRFDFKNSLYFLFRSSIGHGSLVSARIGGVWNRSNIEGAEYLQPAAAVKAIITFLEKNLVMTQLFSAYALYEPVDEEILKANGNGNGKGNNKKTTIIHSEPRIPFYSFYCGYERELTPKVSPHLYYMITLYGTGETSVLQVSHQTGLMLFWSWK